MRLTVKPARRPGTARCLVSRMILESDIAVAEDGSVTLSIITDDIYTKNAQQRFDITLNRSDFALLATRLQLEADLSA